MFRKFFAALALAALLMAGFVAFAGTPAHAADRDPCVKVINGVEVRTCATWPSATASMSSDALPWWAVRARHPRTPACRLPWVRCGWRPVGPIVR